VHNVLIFALLGVGDGALISGLGIGIVLSYRGSGLINISIGALAMLSGYSFWALRTGYFGLTLASGAALVATYAVAAALASIFECLVVIPLRDAAPLAKLVASLGFLISSMATITIIFGPAAWAAPSLFSDRLVHIFGAPLILNRFFIAAIIVGIGIVCVLLSRYTGFGIATRAAAENERYATLIGLSPRRISFVNTILMAFTAATVGVLAGSIQVLDPTDLSLLVVSGLAAALFGGLASFGVTLTAGILMGATTSLVVLLSTYSWFPAVGSQGQPMPGITEFLTFVFLVIAVITRGGHIRGRGEIPEKRLPTAPETHHPWRSTATYGAIAATALYVFPAGYRQSLIMSLIDIVLMFSVVVVTGYVGQVSAAQLAIAGMAAFGTGEAAILWHLDSVPAALLGITAATILGLIMAIPAVRVRGVSLAIVTLAAAVAIEDFVLSNPQVVDAGMAIPTPTIFGWNYGPGNALAGIGGTQPSPVYGWVVLGVVILVALFISKLRRSRIGKELLAVRANERAASSVGICVRNVKLIGFALASMIAGIGGVLIAFSSGTVLPSSYDTITALSLIAFAYIGGITTIQGAVIGGFIFTGNLLTVWLQNWFGVPDSYTTLLAGLVLIATLVWLPDGIGGALFYANGRLPGRRKHALLTDRVTRSSPRRPRGSAGDRLDRPSAPDRTYGP
jgi:branched-chain amino acid transport system permease protein